MHYIIPVYKNRHVVSNDASRTRPHNRVCTFARRATLDLNLRHITLEKKTTHDVHSRKSREKDRDLRNLKKAELQLRVALDALQHFELVYEKIKSIKDSQPKDDGSQLRKRESLHKEVAARFTALASICGVHACSRL